jgi:hypothetical protein
MRKRSSTKINDFAGSLVDLVTGNPIAEDISPIAGKEKNPAAVALGRLGGLKGGKARAEKLSAEERSSIARKASRARWKK